MAGSLKGLASVAATDGDLNRAVNLYRRALRIQEEGSSPDHPQVAELLSGLAAALLRLGEGTEALQASLRAETIARKHFQLTARGLSETEALAYASSRTSGLNLALSMLRNRPEGPVVEAVWNSVIRSRALIFDEMAVRHQVLRQTDDPAIRQLHGELSSARTQLANLVVRAPGDLPTGYGELLEKVWQRKQRLERELASQSRAFRREQVRKQIGLSEVASNLPSGSVLVAFTRYLESGSGEVSYQAFLLPARQAAPLVIPIGKADEIEKLILRWRSLLDGGVSASTRSDYRQVAGSLRERLWDPISPHLENAERIFLVPDGAVNLVSFAALPTGADQYLVETGPILHYLSTERDLVPSENQILPGKGMLAMGGPAFDKIPPPALAQGETEDRMFRGQRSQCSDFQSLNFRPLPKSALEAQEVASLWRGSTQTEEALLLMDRQAGEAAFKREAPTRRILHLATHGFVLGGNCSAASDESRGVGRVVSRNRTPVPARLTENPLLLSGLALTGANVRTAARPGEEDGILTGEEIATLDLEGVDLAVLSACDTGLGEIRAGEGVLGLRRAFQIAGVDTLIMSLWSVKDESTRLWMNAFYRAYLVENVPLSEAVRDASLAMLQHRREQGQSTHPSYWAGFVAAGDWR